MKIQFLDLLVKKLNFILYAIIIALTMVTSTRIIPINYLEMIKSLIDEPPREKFDESFRQGARFGKLLVN